MTLTAFKDPASGMFVITGKNGNGAAQSLSVDLQNLATVSTMNYYYTDQTHNFTQGSNVAVTNQSFSISVPANCVFTLTKAGTATSISGAKKAIADPRVSLSGKLVAHAAASVDFSLPRAGIVDCSIIDSQGRVVATKSAWYPSGTNQAGLSVPSLSNGIYLVRLTSARDAADARIMVAKQP
jgi:hypothetical protein